MRFVKSAVGWIDRVVEWVGSYLMVAMVLIVFWQVFSRYVLHHTPSWTDEVTLMLMMWFGFLSIVIGFRTKSHLAIAVIVKKFSISVQRAIDKIIDLLVIGFGVLLLVEGTKFTNMMWTVPLPVTQIPQAYQYLVIPITGVLTIIYGLYWLFSKKGGYVNDARDSDFID